jgi:cobalt/nickel transport system permease protein
MANLFTAQAAFDRLEDLAEGSSPIHRLHPSVKIIVTTLYIVLVVSFDRYNISGLSGFAIYPAVLLALSQVPIKPLLIRFMAALPFGLFGGAANLFYDRETAFTLGAIAVSYGAVSFAAILLKTLFTVSAALILISTTRITAITEQLVRFHLPSIFALSFMTTYRYISVFLSEVRTCYNAYILRSRGKGIAIKDMGFFCGGLFIKSYDRADRIYSAMKCRGFNGTIAASTQKVDKNSLIFMLAAVSILICLRFADPGALFGRIFLQP